MSFCCSIRVLGFVLVIDDDVEISSIPVVRSASQASRHLLARFDCQNVAQVEHCLLPVRVLGVRTGGEPNGFVAGRELNVEPGDKSMDEVVAADGEIEGKLECEVVGGAFVEIKGDDGAGIGDNGFEFDCVDQRFCEGCHLQRCVVKAVDVVPNCSSCQCI